MGQRTTISAWTAVALLGLASEAFGQNSPPLFSDPAFTRQPSIGAQIDWSGNMDIFRFASNEKPVVMGVPTPAPASPPFAGPAAAPFSGQLNAVTGPFARPNLPPSPTPPPQPSGANQGQGNLSVPTPTPRPDTKSLASRNGGSDIVIDEPLPKDFAHHQHGDAGSELLNQSATGNNRLFLQLDLLTWSVSAPNVVTIGDTASEGVVNVGGNSYFRSNSLNTGFINSDWSLGGRLDFGRIEDRRGWMGSVLFHRHDDELAATGVWFVPSDPDGLMLGYQDSDNDGIDDDVNNNQIHGRSGQDLGTPDATTPGTFIAPFDGTPDQGAPIDSGDLVNWLITFSTFTATNSTDLTGFELMDVFRPNGAGVHTVDWFYGLRYLEFRERFGVVASGGTLDTSSWNVDSDNDILGPQIGVRWAANREWFRFTAEGRFLAGYNFQSDRLNGGIAMNASAGGSNGPVALEASSFNSLQHNSEFSPMGEWRMEASYYASSWLAFRIGYTGMAIGGVSRASPKVSYALPNFGLTGAGSDETLLVNGLNIGLEINR